MTQRGENVGVDLAGKDHLGHLQRIVVGHPAAFDDGLFDSHFRCQFSQLFAAAMNDANPNADLMQQGQLFRQSHQPIVIFRHLA